MADVNGGALSFTSIMDNDQMNAAIEETLRRVQGFSDAVVGSGDTMDDTTKEIVESIQIQKRVIEELEKTVADLNERINSVEPGTAQDALIEQANAARAELDGEKQGMVALINELNNLQRANEGAASASEDIRNGLSQIAEACEMHENAIAALKKEYEQITQTMNGALKSGNDNEYRALRDRAQAIKGEIATRKSLLNELREQSNALEDEASRMEKARAAAENTAQAHVSLRQQIRALKEEMADAIANGIDEQSEAYKRMVNELGRLQDIQGDIQSQGSILANDEATFAAALSGLNGVVGGFTAAQGAAALFAGENENLQKIMLKVQSLMSITIGLQQVAQTLNKDSAFSLIILNKAKEWWNTLLTVGRGEQIASTAATAADTTATIASTAATTANAAAEQASNIAKTASVGASTGAAAAQAVQTASATAGTVANIGLAGAFRMVGAAITSIPVFGWILAGISALIALVSHFVSKAYESKKATEEWYNAISENAYKPIASIMELSDKWNALGNDLEAKKIFIENNKKAFEDLGVAIHDVVDAENVLVANKTAFINAQIEKAKATIYLQQAQEKVKELIKKEQEYNAMSDTKYILVQTSSVGMDYLLETANDEKKKAKTALDSLRAEIKNGFQNAANAERNGWNILKKAGIGATQTYTKGSLGAIKQAIQLKQEALKHLTNNDDYKKAMAEIEKLQKQADKIAGETTTTSGSGSSSSGGGGTKKDAFLEKLAKYKSEYSRFLKWVNSNEPIIQQAAKKEFDGLLKQGATYIDYLKNQRDIILQVDVANRSKAQNKQLRQLNDAIAEETKKTVLEAFNNELSESLSNAKTVIEMLNVIEAKRKQLANDGTELDNAEKEALDNAEKQAQEKAKQQTDALLTEYASFVEQKRRLEEQFNADMELLNRKRAKASTDAERAEIDQAIANRTKKYNTDTSNVGDYDAILNQYGGYEQKKERIAEQYAERRRIAELNGNKDLLEKLAKAEQDELSELQSDLIKNSGDWQNLFGNLDELTTKTIKRLIAKIEGMKATIGVDLNPQDLKALTDQLNKARSEVEKRNPFTTLGAAWKRLKEATKDGKGLGSDEAKKATKDVATAVSGSIDLINGTFNAVTNGLQKMGVSMDEETQAILGDIGSIMDGASQVSQGIATGNPLSVIQGSIGLLSSAYDLFNSRDRKAEKQIKKHQKAIKQLENAYKQLEWQIGKALGGEVYKNQQAAIRNMKEQQEHLKASWEAEESKKKTDHDRVNDFKEQYEELGRQIEDMIDEISNDLLQTTAKDFANDLGDALVEAFSKGEDAAKAMETTVNSVLKNLVVNQLKKKFLENQLQGALDKLEKDMGYWNGEDFVFDGLTQPEIDRFKSAVGAASSNFNQALKKYEEIFKDMGLDDTDESLTGAVKGVSEETANILAGQMNAIRINQIDANEVLRQSLQALNTIAINTAYNKYLSRIERIITIMESNQGGNALRSQGLS